MKAKAQMSRTSQAIVDDITGTPGFSAVAAEDFEPLGEHVKAEVELLSGAEMQSLLARWKTANVPPAPDGFVKDLSLERVASYVGAAAARMRNLLLDASPPRLPHAPTGRIESRKEEPYFEVFAYPGSTLAEEQQLPANLGGPVRLFAEAMGRHISTMCNVPHSWGDHAWRLLAATLDNSPNVLSKLDVRCTVQGPLEVSLAS